MSLLKKLTGVSRLESQLSSQIAKTRDLERDNNKLRHELKAAEEQARVWLKTSGENKESAESARRALAGLTQEHNDALVSAAKLLETGAEERILSREQKLAMRTLAKTFRSQLQAEGMVKFADG